MKHTLLAPLLSIGLLAAGATGATGCAHGHASSRGSHDGTMTFVLVTAAIVGAAVLAASISEGSEGCTDPLGRCGSYEPRPPESR